MTLKKILNLSLSIVILTLFSCGESNSTKAIPQVDEPLVLKESETTDNPDITPETITIPAVVIRDDVSLWGNDEGILSAKSITKLDMGTEVVYLGKDEDLKSGSKSYKYSLIRLNNGVEGWISTVRLVKNAKVAVAVVESGLYSRPSRTSPINRTIPAGQIVAVSLDDGIVDGYVKITFSFYSDNKISAPENRFIPLENLSSSSTDMDTAKLVLKAFRNEEQRNDFFNLAFSIDSIFTTTGIIMGEQNGYKYPEIGDDPIALSSNIEILAINPQNEGESEPWILVQREDSQLLWLRSDAVKSDVDPVKGVLSRPALTDFSIYKGSGTQSVILYPGLSFRIPDKDKDGNEIMKSIGSLELGQVVYYMNDEMSFNNINYSKIELSSGKEGWCSKAYLAIDTVPAVITKTDVSQFKEAKLTALSPIKLKKFQIIAQSLNEDSGFFKISYLSTDKSIGFQRDVYVQKTAAPSSYMTNDIDATLLFQMCLSEEDPELIDLYLRKAGQIPSFFVDEISDLFYEHQSGSIESETPETETPETEKSN